MSAVSGANGTSSAPKKPASSNVGQNLGRIRPVNTILPNGKSTAAKAAAAPVAGAAGVTLLSNGAAIGSSSGYGVLASRIKLASSLYQNTDLCYFIYKRYQESRPGKTCIRMEKLLAEAHGFEGLDVKKLLQSFEKPENAGFGFSKELVDEAQKEHAEAKKKSAETGSGAAVETITGVLPPPSQRAAAAANKFAAAMAAIDKSASAARQKEVAETGVLTMFNKPMPKPATPSAVVLQASTGLHQSEPTTGLHGPNRFAGWHKTFRFRPVSEWTMHNERTAAVAVAAGNSTPQAPQKPITASDKQQSDKEKEAAKPVAAAPATPAAAAAGQ